MPTCDMCRTQVKRRINLKKFIGNVPEKSKVDKWLKDNLMACKKCLQKAPQSIQWKFPKVPDHSIRDVNCKPCARAIVRMRKGPGYLGSNLSQACTEIASCETCIKKSGSCTTKVCKEMDRVVKLLRKWKKSCDI